LLFINEETRRAPGRGLCHVGDDLCLLGLAPRPVGPLRRSIVTTWPSGSDHWHLKKSDILNNFFTKFVALQSPSPPDWVGHGVTAGSTSTQCAKMVRLLYFQTTHGEQLSVLKMLRLINLNGARNSQKRFDSLTYIEG